MPVISLWDHKNCTDTLEVCLTFFLLHFVCLVWVYLKQFCKMSRFKNLCIIEVYMIWKQSFFSSLIANVITDSVGHILLLFIWLGSPVYRWYLMDQHGTIGKCGQMKSFLISDLCGIFSVSQSEHPCVSRAGSGQLKKLLWRRWRRWFPMVVFFFWKWERPPKALCVKTQTVRFCFFLHNRGCF